jgi:hypothetical protein
MCLSQHERAPELVALVDALTLRRSVFQLKARLLKAARSEVQAASTERRGNGEAGSRSGSESPERVAIATDEGLQAERLCGEERGLTATLELKPTRVVFQNVIVKVHFARARSGSGGPRRWNLGLHYNSFKEAKGFGRTQEIS